ncbi:diphthine synthase [Candidatus Woesearchaeota archaeon]|nr:diphthine synthase [Candidatus Woesearchaeota archaeon]
MLNIIGLGLWDEKDISVRGLEIVKKCSKLYLESYTSRLGCPLTDLEEFYGKKIIKADREMVEKKAEETILKDAETEETGFLVIGDVFGATTHIDLLLRAKEKGIKVNIVHNASVLTAVGVIGLELYKYGKVTSIPFDNKDVTSPVEVLDMNKKNGLHTLFLLDLRPDEERFMTVKEAAEYLISKGVSDEVCISCGGLGSPEPEIKKSKLSEVKKLSLFPQCLIIPGKLHFIEEEALNKLNL